MTAPGPLRPTPGSAAFVGRPAGALWVLLLIGFLVGLPCASSAHAVAPATVPQAAIEAAAPAVHPTSDAPARTTPAPSARRAQPTHASHGVATAQITRTAPAPPPAPAEPLSAPARPMVLCTADGPGPPPGDGCTSHPFSGQDSQLPNAPPHPVPAALPQLVTLRPTPTAGPSAGTPGPAPAPDLHLLQVNRT
ncbi:hypothetical protein [Kitasatospora mediocidica]|uniref:hypothetical protein n=1 Tax=Kitasatospora mediocidica TaxID=58352 RepID=UPI000A8DF263|nr:hypothetical protein [Kitasatospora mediocidica]